MMKPPSDPPETMFINPLLALLFEAGCLQADIEDYVKDKAVEERMQRRLLHISRLAECIRYPVKAIPIADVMNPPAKRNHPFPVIKGGKQ